MTIPRWSRCGRQDPRRAPRSRSSSEPGLAMSMWDALKKVEARFAEIDQLLSTPEVAGDPRKLRDLSKERAQTEPTIRTLGEYRRIEQTVKDDEAAVASGDAELAELANAELPELREKLTALEAQLKHLLLPRDPDDDKNV